MVLYKYMKSLRNYVHKNFSWWKAVILECVLILFFLFTVVTNVMFFLLLDIDTSVKCVKTSTFVRTVLEVKNIVIHSIELENQVRVISLWLRY
jgi:hypothetical protein